MELAEAILYKKHPVSDEMLSKIIDRIDLTLTTSGYSTGGKEEKMLQYLVEVRKNLNEHNMLAEAYGHAEMITTDNITRDTKNEFSKLSKAVKYLLFALVLLLLVSLFE